MIKLIPARHFYLRHLGRKCIVNLMMFLGITLSVSLLCSCSLFSGNKNEQTITLDITADQDINPNIYGEPAPLAITFYSMKTAGFADDINFFDVSDEKQQQDEQGLKKIYQSVIQPGESLRLRLKIPVDTRAIGMTGAFREIENAQWKAELIFQDLQEKPFLKRIVTLRKTNFYARFKRLGVTLGERE